MDSYMGFSN